MAVLVFLVASEAIKDSFHVAHYTSRRNGTLPKLKSEIESKSPRGRKRSRDLLRHSDKHTVHPMLQLLESIKIVSGQFKVQFNTGRNKGAHKSFEDYMFVIQRIMEFASRLAAENMSYRIIINGERIESGSEIPDRVGCTKWDIPKSLFGTKSQEKIDYNRREYNRMIKTFLTSR